MIKELDENLKDKEKDKYNPAIVKKQKYIDLLKRTKKWGAYLHFYSPEERQLVNDMIDEFQDYINNN